MIYDNFYHSHDHYHYYSHYVTTGAPPHVSGATLLLRGLHDLDPWTHGPMDRWGVARNQQKLLVFYRQKWLVKQQNDMVFPLNVDKCGVFSGL